MTDQKPYYSEILEDGRALVNHDSISVNTQQDDSGLLIHTKLTYVLVGGAGYLRGYDGDLAVYYGIGSPTWVANHGSKANYELAKWFFPNLTENRYRH